MRRKVWTFVMSNASFRNEPYGLGVRTSEVRADKVKIVCVDSRLLAPQT